MIETTTHKMKKPEHGDFILDTIDMLASNFDKIDSLLDEKANYLNTFLKSGASYARAKKIWNLTPEKDGTVGWINVRTGIFANTWQERKQYSIGDLVCPTNNNGHVYQCVENGVSGIAQPQFPTASNESIFDTKGAYGWIANKVYEVDDIAWATSGNTVYHYRCITRGTSNSLEPSWATSSGTTINDGSVVWQTYKTVKWKEVGVSCDFRPFGTIL